MKKNKQHTVSRCYLEKFTDEDGLLWVLNANNKIFRTKPESILTEKHFYTITLPWKGGSFIIEDTLANIESKYARIFDTKIEKEKGLTKEERGVVAIFVASMLQRTKPQRESLRNMFIELDKKMEKWRLIFEQNPKARRLSSTLPRSGESISHSDVKKVIEKFGEFHSVSLIKSVPELARIIFRMQWAILIPEKKKGEFITSDNPCALLRPEATKKFGPNAFGSRPGLIYKETELTLPLSSKRALLAGWKLEHETYFTAPHWLVEQINYRSIMYATEKIIAADRKKLEEIRDKSRNKSQ